MPILADDLNTGQWRGLSAAEAAARLQAQGCNELPSAQPRSFWAIAWGVVREPMLLLLLGAGGVYLLLGDLREALMLLAFVVLVTGITLYQEGKTEKALASLRRLASPRALVLRDGEQQRIPGREVVVGDLILLAEGDRVPADATVLACRNLFLDESLLTGESEPVGKEPCASADTPLGPASAGNPTAIYSGSLVVGGLALARVAAIGLSTELGRIGRALSELETEPTPLQTETSRLVWRLAWAGAALCTLVVVLYGLTRQDWLHGFLAGLTLAMAMLPEEFPVVLAIFLALGAWRISQHRVLTRRIPAVETLGSATVLCTDKTGTLTENRMSLAAMQASGESCDLESGCFEHLPENFHQLLEFGVLASQEDPVDPMERAIREAGEKWLGGSEHWHQDWELVREYPLTRELLAISHVWRGAASGQWVVAAKGAPEAVADLCHLDAAATAHLDELVRQMGAQGLRTLGVAAARQEARDLPDGQHDFQFQFMGLLGLRDPLRASAPQAIAECYRAGIRVIMITGDHPTTARCIAAQAGLRDAERVITGAEMAAWDQAELERRLDGVNVFARVAPEEKLRLVQALKAQGQVVAMTGDGVNDAPALKAAHIGVAMGARGTDVAREAADLVLLDDDFASIVAAVRLGRRIFDNLKKAMAYVLAVHVPIAGLSLAPVLLGWPLILLPVHIVFLEMIIDPSCTLVFEAEPGNPGLMERPPRDPAEPLFNWRIILLSLLQGVSVLTVLLVVYLVTSYRGQGPDEARALTFTSLVVANLGLILTNRSWSLSILGSLRRPNPALWWVLGGAAGVLGLVLFLPGLRNLFHFCLLHWPDLLICLAAGFLGIAWFEVFKFFRRRRPAARS
ncbi:MAG: cation-translocating P-type ATPase [Deltaproteobacteria bacterium]|nr:cation-translocating P-type ATPase [Deltaproteobacteria bacterium]